MNCWPFVDVLSTLLDPAERDAVRGDIAEANESSIAALRDIFGLLIRRQAQEFNPSRAWMTLFMAIPCGLALAYASLRAAGQSAIYLWMYFSNWTAGYLNGAFRLDTTRDLGGLAAYLLALLCWSWSAGFLLASLARRAIFINAALLCTLPLLAAIFYIAGAPRYGMNDAAYSSGLFRIVPPLIMPAAFVVLPALRGMYRAIRIGDPSPLLWTSLFVTTAMLAAASRIRQDTPTALLAASVVSALVSIIVAKRGTITCAS